MYFSCLQGEEWREFEDSLNNKNNVALKTRTKTEVKNKPICHLNSFNQYL